MEGSRLRSSFEDSGDVRKVRILDSAFESLNQISPMEEGSVEWFVRS